MVSKLYKYINNKFGKLDNPFWDLLRYIVLGLASVLSTGLVLLMLILFCAFTIMLSKWLLVAVVVLVLIVLIGRITFILYCNDPK